MISVNFTLSWFATGVEGRMRRSSKGPEPMPIQPITQGTYGAGAGGTI
jgi:glutamate transport system permease protein